MNKEFDLDEFKKIHGIFDRTYKDYLGFNPKLTISMYNYCIRKGKLPDIEYGNRIEIKETGEVLEAVWWLNKITN
jgi:hypothetical protein